MSIAVQAPRATPPKAVVEGLRVRAFRVPTASPESDGTLAWHATTLVLVEATSSGVRGRGYSYADVATAHFIEEHLTDSVEGLDAWDVASAWRAMVHEIRNMGRPGVASMAISAVDTALWDLKARLLGLPLAQLFGMAHERVAVYGSGGFTSYSIPKLTEQLGAWASEGMTRVKMKVGRDPSQDAARVKAVRETIGPDVQIFVDANGAYTRKQALAMAQEFARYGVTWFEEPVSSDDLEGLRLLRDRGPEGMAISAGEYGYDLPYFKRMLEAEAVDVLQADVTRCGGFTGWLSVAALCEARSLPLSSHCAPALHLPAASAATPLCHMEYFFDHYRIESMLFDGAPKPVNGYLAPDLSRPGLGLELNESEAARYAIYGNH